MAPAKSKRPLKKRLIVACDGTWMNLDRAPPSTDFLPNWLGASTKNASLTAVPSNVTRICRTIAHESKHGVPQIVYYSAGVGSGDSWYDRIFGGMTGDGVDDNIREAYAFIQSNWNDGDEIVLLGFSRGAFTARSVAAFLSAAGVLTRTGMNEFQNIFQDWECQLYDGYQAHWPQKLPPAERPSFLNGSYAAELANRGMTRLNVPIKAVAVWDTVGSLGIPDIGPFAFRKRLSFVSSEVCSSVEHAFQALALDEERRSFSPAIWELPSGPNRLKALLQCWFPGVHCNIGSGYNDTEIADLTLSWMISKLQAYDIIDFLPEAVIEHRQLGVKWIMNAEHSITRERWGLGKLYDSMTAFYWLGGRMVRSPGRNCRMDPRTGEFTEQRLSGTNECIHPSVRMRMALRGKGVGTDKVYQPKALDGWEVAQSTKSRKRIHVWKSEFRGDCVELPEEKLEGLELALLKASPGVYEIYTDGMED